MPSYETDPAKRPGWQTSEVWITALVLILGFVLIILDKSEAGMWMLGAGLAALGVNYSRARVKEPKA